MKTPADTHRSANARQGTPVSSEVRLWRLASVARLAVLLMAIAPLAGSAQAAVFCVNKSSCSGTSSAGIQQALDAAAANGVTDTVLIGSSAGAYVGSFSYVDSETVHLVGDGAGQTIVAGNGVSDNTITLLNPASTIEDMTIRAPDQSNGSALRWDGTAKQIEARHLGSSATSTYGLVMQGNARLTNSTVNVNGFRAVTPQNSTGASIEDTTIVSGGTGIQTAGTAKIDLSRVSIRAPRGSMSIGGGGSSSTIDNVVFEMTGTNGGDAALSVFSGAHVLVSHGSVIGSDAGRGMVVDSSTGPATLTVSSSVVENFTESLGRFGGPTHAANLGVSYSNYTDGVQNVGTGSLTLGAGNTQAPPQFVNQAARNFVPLSSSPLIDAGVPSDPFALDFDKQPRVVDGDGTAGARSDIGAFEYRRRAPVAAASGPSSAGVGQQLQFSAAGSNDPDQGDVLSYEWSFGDGSTANGSGAQHSFSTAGVKTVVLTVSDPTGLTDTATVQVVVTGGTQPAGGGATGGSTGTGDGSTATAPTTTKLASLRVSPKRIKRGRGLPKLVRGAGKGISFELSAPAKVTVVLERCRSSKGCASRGKAGSKTFAAPAGKSTISFKGRFSRKRALRPGRYQVRLTVEGGASATASLAIV